MKAIAQWLAGNRNFQKGKILYDKFGFDTDLKALFQKGKSKQNQAKLIRALSDLLNSKSLNAIAAKTNQRTRANKPDKDIAPELAKVIKQKNDLYIIVRNMHSKMQASDSKEVRKDLAGQILNTWDTHSDLWYKIDYWHKYGKMPEVYIAPDVVIKADTTDVIDMYMRYRTLATYISKAKKNNKQEAMHKAILESNAIADIINKDYGFQKIKNYVII